MGKKQPSMEALASILTPAGPARGPATVELWSYDLWTVFINRVPRVDTCGVSRRRLAGRSSRARRAFVMAPRLFARGHLVSLSRVEFVMPRSFRIIGPY